MQGERVPSVWRGSDFAVDGHYFAPSEDPSGNGALAHFDTKEWHAIALVAGDTQAQSAPQSVWASSAEDVLAVAESRVWRWRDGNVRLEHEAEAEGVTLNAVWGAARDDVWVGGYATLQGCADCNVPPKVELLHYDGANWRRQSLELEGTIHALWGAAPDDVWAAGSVLLHYDGVSWQHVMDLDGSEARLWGAGADAIWLATGDGLILHADGKTWQVIDSGDLRISDVQGLPDGRVFAYVNAPERQLLEWNGTTFVAAELDLPALSSSVPVGLGSDGRRLLMLAGKVFALDGDRFELWLDPSPRAAVSAAGRAAVEPSRLLAVRGLSLVALDEQLFTPVADLSELGPDLVIYDVAASDEDDVWLGGLLSETAVFHWDGATLARVDLPDESQLSFPKVVVDVERQLWVAGVQLPALEAEDPVGRVRVFGFDGSTWEDASPELDGARGVELSVAGGQVWVTTNDGRVAVRENGSWKRADVDEDAGDVTIAAVAANDVYAIATGRSEDDAQLLHYDGSGWSPVEELADRPLRYVDGAGPHDVWATGYPRTLGRQVVVRFDGERWQELDATPVDDIALPTALPDGRALLASDLGVWLYDCGRH